jgi:flap endonuclease-1
VKAYKFVKEVGMIESVIDRIISDEEKNNKKKYNIPENFFFKEARVLFKEPDAIYDKAVLDENVKWNKPDDEALKEFLVG